MTKSMYNIFFSFKEWKQIKVRWFGTLILSQIFILFIRIIILIQFVIVKSNNAKIRTTLRWQ